MRTSLLPLLLLLPIGVVAAVACGSFGTDGTGDPNARHADAAADDASAPDASAPDASAITATIRCDTLACEAGTKCCLPLDHQNPSCIDPNGVCGAGYAELLCSRPSACQAGEVCCVASQRNDGQTAFDLARSFCVTATSCPDQNLQHSLCQLGNNGECATGACKPYLRDRDDAQQDLPVNPTGYSTCQ